jgi:predicted GNAT family acetyltransferase
MDARGVENPVAYAELVLPFLLRAPARHNLFLGILDTLQRRPTIYPFFHLWVVQDDGEVVGAALQTPPHNIAIAEPGVPGAVDAMVEAIVEANVRPPGVVGGVEEARAFADAWCARFGGEHITINRQGVYELTAIRDAGAAEGAARLATEVDLPLLLAWHADFVSEAVPDHVGDDDAMRRRLTALVADGGFWLWASGDVVSMTGASAAPPAGVRIGPVYTPPSRRGHGFATALVAHASAHALAHGVARCWLHTDLANPTSNAIYQRIGYEWVCEATELRFTPG